MEWTKEQKQAIKKKGSNLLVSAGAGSGKTTILISRIIDKIVNEKINVDDLLVVTFTNAAASEMKEKLIDKLYEEIEKKPNDIRLRNQISLINQAHISTIHAFCLDIIRNNFYETKLSGNFRVADENEIEIIKQDVMEKVFEEKYEEGDQNFIRLLNLYTTYKDDQPLKDLIFNLYNFLTGIPDSREWLNNSIEEFNTKETDFFKTSWGKIIYNYVSELIDSEIKRLERAKALLSNNLNLIDFYNVISDDLNDLQAINFDSYDNAYNKISTKEWAKWPSKRKNIDESDKELKEKAKKLRDSVSSEFKEFSKKMFYMSSSENMEDINKMYQVLLDIKNLEITFEDEFKNKKLEKNIVDFSDIEHIAYNLLVDEKGNKTAIAQRYSFNEIMIDEYQDSSLIQEKILNSVSNGKNIFMVGDVKQSIYRFRQARPELFLQKYNTYKIVKDNEPENDITRNDNENISNDELNSSKKELESNSSNNLAIHSDNVITENSKILLYKNFRSRKNILDFVNAIFSNIMSKELGEIDYTEEEYLNCGKEFEDVEKNIDPELYVIQDSDDSNLNDDKNNNEMSDNNIAAEDNKIINDETETEEQEEVEKNTLQARFIASEIKELVKQGYKYSDITILLKSPNIDSPNYEKELIRNGIPVYADVGENYLQTIEIDTVLSVLKIIDNPLQDIPLVTVMRSMIGGFSDNDLIEIRLNKRKGPFCYALEETAKQESNLGKKSKKFIELINKYREESLQISIDELIWKIITETGYYYYVSLMPNGKLREANLQKLFEKAKDYEKISLKGIFNFITFMEKVEQNTSNSMIGAKIINENDDVVRIMSIHKSKGLEFKVVFIASMEKEFNFQDSKSKIVYDQDVGFGVNFVSEGIDYKTITKEAINLKARKEKISEEMRVLYVALTRAKERLFLVGYQKDVNKKLKDMKNEMLVDSRNSITDEGKFQLGDTEPLYLENKNQNEMKNFDDRKIYNYKDNNYNKINPTIIGKHTNYLDWVEMVYENDNNLNLKIKIVNKQDLKEPDETDNLEENYKIYEDDLENFDEKKYEDVNRKLNYEYSLKNNDSPSKTSATALKNSDIILDNNIVIVEDMNNSEKDVDIEKFNDGNNTMSAAEKGTIIHLALQKLNDDNIDKMVTNLKITDEQRQFLIDNKKVLENYTNSKLFADLKNAREVHKEESFYMNVQNKNRENILLQGMIDLYYINDKDELILVDYKTDKNVDENILIERYKNQLMLYRNALEKSLNKKVDKTIIYSTFLNKEVLLNL